MQSIVGVGTPRPTEITSIVYIFSALLCRVIKNRVRQIHISEKRIVAYEKGLFKMVNAKDVFAKYKKIKP